MTDDLDPTTNAASSGGGGTLVLGRRAALLLPLAAGLGGCSVFDTLFNSTKKKLPGQREDVMPVSAGLEAPHGEHPEVTLPPQTSTDWPQEGGTLDHVAGNAALADDVHQVWAVSIGSGSAYRRQVTTTPVVVGDSIYTMDSSGTVSAFRVADGSRLWRTTTRPKKSRSTNVGGGIGYDSGTLFVATGYSELMAMDAATGKIGWREPLDTPARSAPTIADGVVLLSTIDQVMLGVSAKDGRQIWSYDGTAVSTTLLGQPAPAYASGIAVAGFGSGDLVGIRGDSGAVAWTDSIAAASGQEGVAQISAITGRPVIMGERVLAIGTAGLMVAIDLRAGRRLWEREVSGIQSPVAAGDFVFVTTTDQQVAALLASTGDVAWLTQLPQYKRAKTQGAPIIWTGPVLAGGRLIYGGTRNDLIMLDAVSGKITGTMKLPSPVTVAPIAANGTLYLITDDGLLRAYR